MSYAASHSETSPVLTRRARLRRWWRRRVLAHRRLLAFCCVVAAVLAALYTVAPPAPPTQRVQVAARDLDSGTVLADGDLTWAAYAPENVPAGALPSGTGRTLAAPMRRGEPVTDARVVSPDLMAGYPGLVATPVRITDPATVDLLRVGDQVDLLDADPRAGRAPTVARGAPVVALPREPDGVSGQATAGRVVVVALSPTEVEAVTGAAVRGFLTAVWSR